MPGVGEAIAAFATLVVSGTTATAFFARLAVSVALSVVSSKLFGPSAPDGVGLRPRDITTRSALEYRQIVYGEAMVSGPIVYQNVSGVDNEFLWTVIPLAWGRSDSIQSVRFDSEVIDDSEIDWTPGTGASDGTGTADVSTARWIGANSTNAVQIRFYLGYDDQPVSAALDTPFADVDSNFRLRGVTYMVLRFLYDEDTEQVWEDGLPTNMRALVRGRLIYDPRLDSTNGGSGSHRYTDSTTWAWSDNPALCLADYLMTYMGVDPAASIDWSSVSSAADDCDVSVAIPTSSTETRFTCNGVLSAGDTHKRNIEAILSSFDGRLTYRAGQWAVRASVWEASSTSIAAADIIGDVKVRGSAPRSDRFNTVRGFFVDPTRDYKPVEFAHVTASEFTTRDNNRTLDRDLQLPMTNTETMAQRIAFRILEQGDNQVIADLVLNKKGANIAAGDVVDVTLSQPSWSAKTFRVIQWKRQPDGSYALQLREDASASYTDPAEGDYSTSAGSGITTPADLVRAPSNLAATSIQSGIRLTWTNPPGRLFEWIDVYESSTNAWSGATLRASTRSDRIELNYEAGTTRYFWIRARNFLETESNREPNSDTSTITATAGAIAIETPVQNEITDGNSSYTSGTQPRAENNALSQNQAYTSPSNIATRCLINWTVQLQIDVSTSGVAVGEAFGRIRITVNGVQQYSKEQTIEITNLSSDRWKSISGSFEVNVPAGQEVIAYLESYRTFSTSGTSPAQQHSWQNGVINILPIRSAVT